MKRLILFLGLISLYLCGFSQSEVNKLTFDNGYYQGIHQDNNPKSKYITFLYLQFLSNNEDTVLIVLPYRMKKTSNLKNHLVYLERMNDTITTYLTELSKSAEDMENREVINHSWSIVGFDNYTYFEIDSNRISFSINIADIETNEIEIFYFDGTIDNYGYEINATIHSDGGTFQKGDIKLELAPTIINER